MEAIFTVRSNIDRELLLQAVWRKTKVFVIIVESLLLVALGLFVFIAIKAHIHALPIAPVYFISAFVALFYLMFWTIYRNYSIVNRQVKQYLATYGQPSVEMEYRFFDDSFEEHNLLTDGKVTLSYENLSLILPCKSQFVLRYRFATLFLPYKGISGGTEDELKAFLQVKISKK